MKDVATSFDNINLTQFLLKTNPNNPTLLIENIIAKRTPLIVFSDYAHSNQKPINGFFYTKHYKESKYDLAEYQGCEDRDKTSRTRYNEKAYNNQIINLFLLNHFYKTSFKVPGAMTYYEINDYHNIKERSLKCQGKFSLFPNFIALDHLEQGNWGGVFAFVNEQNYKTLCAITHNNCASINQVKFSGNSTDEYHNDEF